MLAIEPAELVVGEAQPLGLRTGWRAPAAACASPLVARNDILVDIDSAADGMPAEFDICPLLHVASIEPFNRQDSSPPTGSTP